MRMSISAQSCDSVPPAPGWIVSSASRAVIRAAQHRAELELFDLSDQAVDFADPLAFERFIGVLGDQLTELLELGHFFGEFLPRLEPDFDVVRLRDDFAGRVRIVPESGRRHPFVQLAQLLPFVIQVKDTPVARPAFRAVR